MKVGYARVSTEEQNLGLQIEALRAAGCEHVFEDRGVSGAKPPEERPGFRAAFEHLAPGSVFMVWKLDRVGRSISDLIGLLNQLDRKGIEFASLTDKIDTSTAGGRLVFHMMGALAEFERDLIRERTKAGLASAKRRGKVLGRPKALTPAQVAHAREAIGANRETVSGMAALFGVNRSTIQRALSHTNGVGG